MNDSDPTDGDGFHNPASSAAKPSAGELDIGILRKKLMLLSKEELVDELLGALIELASPPSAMPEREKIALSALQNIANHELRDHEDYDAIKEIADRAILALISGEQAGQSEQMTALVTGEK